MKQMALALMVIGYSSANAMAQASNTDITSRNSWLKVGVNAAVPVGNIASCSAAAAGVEIKGQLMETRNLGIGLTTGYTHFFPKSDYQGFGTLPVGAFLRVDPQRMGFFAGVDGGYSFVTAPTNASGGVYVRPQLGYHNFSWNIFAFYNNIFRSDANGRDIGTAGIGATYNLRFR